MTIYCTLDTFIYNQYLYQYQVHKQLEINTIKMYQNMFVIMQHFLRIVTTVENYYNSTQQRKQFICFLSNIVVLEIVLYYNTGWAESPQQKYLKFIISGALFTICCFQTFQQSKLFCYFIVTLDKLTKQQLVGVGNYKLVLTLMLLIQNYAFCNKCWKKNVFLLQNDSQVKSFVILVIIKVAFFQIGFRLVQNYDFVWSPNP
eukprot:TRINITY_DN5987_c1_g1_i1.p1 TRINITY_DN5987_c1_g1~~TRINITY_DN5987_c1_g1_i1.p1  ORF type:complete len:202 (-),score=-11.59 TRINITY_DN5987_c1_g1_i1:142-747(-)